jgi:cytochrome c biogenesis protein CcdA/thiol-disulfide isomerase/thioredoxin
MIILLLFSFIGGVVTVLSPCILPILPIVLSTGLSRGKKKPWGVITGFVLSFTFFTVFLASIVKSFGINPNHLRWLAAGVIFGFGLVMLVPFLQETWERLAAIFSSKATVKTNREGYWGGLLIGLSLGLVWAPCVGPIMASVITLSSTGEVSTHVIALALAYSIGTSLPMAALIIGGRKVISILPALKKNSSKIQRGFGVLMLAAGLMLVMEWDRKFQAYVLEVFPSYGQGLTKIEDNQLVKDQLDLINKEKTMKDNGGVTAPDVSMGSKWINSDKLSIEELTKSGKVVLVDFWTYTCINCIRTLPYLKTWHEKYADDGLVIIGVHAPEFEFEKDYDNVKKAAEDFDLKYPIVQDNDFLIWRAYNNRYWPAKYLIDTNGEIRYTHFGEGKYEETEEWIAKLLEESGKEVGERIEKYDVYINQTKSPETYLGYWRISGWNSDQQVTKDEFSVYSHGKLSTNQLGYEGEFKVGEKFTEAKKGAKLSFKFDAKQVNLVMKSMNANSKVRISLASGNELGGEDVVDGEIVIDEDRMYRLFQSDKSIKDTITIDFLDDGIEVYAFTFG